MKSRFLFLAGAALPLAALAQFADPFGSIDSAWIANRYAPAGFNAVVFDGGSRLQLAINEADSSANRPLLFSSPFYDIQGEQRAADITGRWTLSAEVYVASAFDTTTGQLVHASLWGHSGTTPAGGDYLILGFTNASPTDALNASAADRAFRFSVYDSSLGENVDLGVPAGFTFDAWHTLSGTSTGATFEYRIDGQLVYTKATSAGEDLLSAMVQGYNFGQAGGYAVYWDNVAAATTAIPEPATTAAFAALTALGIAAWRRRSIPAGGRRGN